MEFEPFTPSSPETAKDEKKNKRKKGVRFGVPLAKVESGQDSAETKPPGLKSRGAVQELSDSIFKNKDTDKQDKPWQTALESKTKPDAAESVAEAVNARADELVEKKELANRAVEKDTEEAAESSEVGDSEAESNDVAEEAEAPEEYRAMLEQELPEGWKGSERVVELQGVTDIDQIIPLRGQAEPSQPEELPMEQPEAPAAFEDPYAVFSRQPEQPLTQAESGPGQVPPAEAPYYTSTAQNPETPAANGGGEVPPTPPPEAPTAGAEQPPEPEPNPSLAILYAATEAAATYNVEHGSGGPVTTNLASAAGQRNRAGERPATKEELDDAFHRSSKLHGQRGALSGLLLGTYFANRRLRRRQLQEHKELERQGKKLEQLQREVHAQGANRPASFEQSSPTQDKRYENPSRPDKLGATVTAERDRQAQRAELNQIQPAELLAIPENHQLQASAWHNIEVDSRTGRPVEAPAFQYGHEYYRERAQEGPPQQQRNAAAGGTVLMAMSSDAPQLPNGAGNTNPPPPAQIPSATTQGAPSNAAQKSSEKRSGTAGPIWPWIVALVGVILCIIVALH